MDMVRGATGLPPYRINSPLQIVVLTYPDHAVDLALSFEDDADLCIALPLKTQNGTSLIPLEARSNRIIDTTPPHRECVFLIRWPKSKSIQAELALRKGDGLQQKELRKRNARLTISSFTSADDIDTRQSYLFVMLQKEGDGNATNPVTFTFNFLDLPPNPAVAIGTVQMEVDDHHTPTEGPIPLPNAPAPTNEGSVKERWRKYLGRDVDALPDFYHSRDAILAMESQIPRSWEDRIGSYMIWWSTKRDTVMVTACPVVPGLAGGDWPTFILEIDEEKGIYYQGTTDKILYHQDVASFIKSMPSLLKNKVHLSSADYNGSNSSTHYPSYFDRQSTTTTRVKDEGEKEVGKKEKKRRKQNSEEGKEKEKEKYKEEEKEEEEEDITEVPQQPALYQRGGNATPSFAAMEHYPGWK